MSNKKITYRETFSLTARAFSLWRKKVPGLVASVLAHAAVSSLVPYIAVYFSARIIGELSGACDSGRLFTLAALAVGIGAAASLLKDALKRWRNSEEQQQAAVANTILSDKMLSLDFSKVDDPATHRLLAKIEQNDNYAWLGLNYVIGAGSRFVGDVVSVLGAVSLSVSLFAARASGQEFQWVAGPAAAAVMIALLVGAALAASALNNLGDSRWSKTADQATYTNRMFGFYADLAADRERAMDVRIYRQDIPAGAAMENNNGFCPGSAIAVATKNGIGLASVAGRAVVCIFIGAVYVYVCLKAWAGAFGIGMVTQYISSLTLMISGVADMLGTAGDLKMNAEYLKIVYEFLDINNEMYRGSLTTEKRSDRRYEIEFDNVSFKYPNSNDWALRNVSIKFTVGERLAVVGENGSGKTTMIKLLCRLYDPTEGEIRLNGIDIRKYSTSDYLAVFSVIFQDFKLLSFPIASNVAASENPDRERVSDCLVRAGLGERLKTLPNGIDTCLFRDFDENGVELSGGEAQKTAIARALYKDAPFIVLDEPTAALDPISEYEIYLHFNDLIGDKTAVYISHRLSSCKFCSRIAVFENGSITETGTHEQLLARGGKYRRLWDAQAQYYTEKESAQLLK